MSRQVNTLTSAPCPTAKTTQTNYMTLDYLLRRLGNFMCAYQKYKGENRPSEHRLGEQRLRRHLHFLQ